ncbi:sigma-54 dependent transcriptional regulator [Marinobacter daepoensis]|uniref:sigma-54 dependent transcriptional regulator n=1 Tax=Marinobacter daepoensis TaxID=262077 RepID=UPI001C98CC8A|nr:sigma-54 dependent transcriptional regulator [Marinobacter daepoensis]MBY6033890.1 sigma-54 dependent transcriptional regulator [Marinobacter daepoensis]
MEPTRPLVWLAAASDHKALPPPTLNGWALTSLNVLRQPFLRSPEYKGIPVGACVLSGLDNSELEIMRLWLEALPVSDWLAVIHRGQLKNTNVGRLIRHYCQDYHTLPLDTPRLANSLGHMWGMHSLTTAAHPPELTSYQNYALEGPSLAIRQTRSLLRRFAATHEPVQISGESGTGKEAAARFVHELSPRHQGPLTIINCAALPESLTQSELFGHERGAFTHALKAQKGRIEMADGGTLVLEGVDELSLTQQSAILRFLEEGTIEPVGANQPVQVNVRIVATSHTPLDQKVAEGVFRRDVFYRLGNLSVALPVLHNRLEDLPYLARQALNATEGERYQLGNTTLMSMALHAWPGNLRELQNRLRQAVLLARQLQIQPEDLGLPPAVLPSYVPRLTLDAYRARADQEAIATSLALTHQNVSAAARLLNISRVTFYRLLEKHQLQLPSNQGLPKKSDHGDLS